jgi:hypothetical protein
VRQLSQQGQHQQLVQQRVDGGIEHGGVQQQAEAQAQRVRQLQPLPCGVGPPVVSLMAARQREQPVHNTRRSRAAPRTAPKVLLSVSGSGVLWLIFGSTKLTM